MTARKMELTGGAYWTLNLKLTFFFDSYGLDGLKHFIIQDDKAIIDKILVGIDKMDRTDKKITLCKVKFSLSACKELTEDEILSLSDTARQFFYFVQSFGNKLNLRSFVNIWMVEDRLQDLKTSTCGIFKFTFIKICSTQKRKAKSTEKLD